MGQALYRKYRPKSLKNIVGQEHITSTLSNAINSGQVSHAYLFTGPRGVGKTSVARILAHELNNFSYDESSSYLDIIEIDAASNRRIDEIRELRDKVNISPTSGKYKIYIIDEVHMLTREAFNALLKTLEEPPNHAIFILATTEAHKVPETIISRTQQFKFRPIPYNQISQLLKQISSKEGIKISDDAIELIAEYGEGSFRDSISLLDQASSTGSDIGAKNIESLLGLAPTELVDNIFESLKDLSIEKLVSCLESINASGYNITILCKQLTSKLRNILVGNEQVFLPNEILDLMKELINVPVSYDPFSSLELLLIGYVYKIKPNIINFPTNINENVTLPIKKEIKIEKDIVENEAKKPEKVETKSISSEKNTISNKKETSAFDKNVWPIVLNDIKAKYNTLYGITRMAVPIFSNETLTLKTKFDFHQRLLGDVKNQKILVDIIENITGKQITIFSKVDKTIDNSTKVAPIVTNKVELEPITTINNIFGSSEVIE